MLLLLHIIMHVLPKIIKLLTKFKLKRSVYMLLKHTNLIML